MFRNYIFSINNKRKIRSMRSCVTDEILIYGQYFIKNSYMFTSQYLRALYVKKKSLQRDWTFNDKQQRQICAYPDLQNRNRSRPEIDNKFLCGATRNSLPVLVAPRRVHVSRSSAAASEQWGFGCIIFNGDNPTCREGLVARASRTCFVTG